MLGKELLEMINKGIHPTIKFSNEILDFDTQFEEQMMGQITSAFEDKDGGIQISINESQFKKYNKELETPSFFNDKTTEYDLRWSDFNERKDEVIFYFGKNDEISVFEIIEDNYSELVKEYNDSKTNLSYVDWLQEQVFMLRALI